MQIVTQGLVLKEVKVGEADRIVTLLTPQQGVISASAKGSLRLKSKLFSACGLFCYAEFSLLEGRTLYTVCDAQVKQVFFGLRESIEATALAIYLAEFALALSPTGKEAQTQLRLLLNCFHVICEKQAPLQQVKAVYELRALCEAGYQPDLLCCAGCKKYEGGAFCFDVWQGNILCEQCAQKAHKQPNISGAALTALRHTALVDDKKIFHFQLQAQAAAQFAQIAEQYALHCLERPLKTLEFWKTMQQ